MTYVLAPQGESFRSCIHSPERLSDFVELVGVTDGCCVERAEARRVGTQSGARRIWIVTEKDRRQRGRVAKVFNDEQP